MKKRNSILLLGALIALQSCAPIYECGNKPAEPLRGGKRLKSTVAQRDSLCVALDDQKAVNQDLKAENERVNSENSKLITLVDQVREEKKDLQFAYDGLLNRSVSTEQELSRALKNKETELMSRERALREMKAVLDRQDSITNRLNQVLKTALLGFNSDELSIDIKNGKVYVSLSDKLLFKSGSAEMESKGQDAIKLLAEVLLKNQDIDVMVEGHTDNLPIKTAVYKDNWDLSVARAASVVRLLTDNYKVSPKQVTPAGRGEFFPKADNATAEGRAKNRRTEIILSPKLDEVMKMLK
ncbi:MAG: OmpA family protein [Bacteroidetes bacterium]|nr:OmpA family protein [Bacteroidota bacterium]